jgi:hypothetical protein
VLVLGALNGRTKSQRGLAASIGDLSLLLSLKLPQVSPYMAGATIDLVHAAPGAALQAGARLLDLKVDLSATAAHDCPPVSFYRLMIREAAWLRTLLISPGADCATGDLLAVFSTEPLEPLDAPPERELRISVASIMPRFTWDEA